MNRDNQYWSGLSISDVFGDCLIEDKESLNDYLKRLLTFKIDNEETLYIAKKLPLAMIVIFLGSALTSVGAFFAGSLPLIAMIVISMSSLLSVFLLIIMGALTKVIDALRFSNGIEKATAASFLEHMANVAMQHEKEIAERSDLDFDETEYFNDVFESFSSQYLNVLNVKIQKIGYTVEVET